MNNIVIQFNSVINDFINQFSDKINTFYINTFNITMKCNPSLFIDSYIIYILPDKDKIYECDESFFLTEFTTSEKFSVFSSYINEIKGVYTNLDTDSKNCVWEYFKCLTLLAEEYVENIDKSESSNNTSSDDSDSSNDGSEEEINNS